MTVPLTTNFTMNAKDVIFNAMDRVGGEEMAGYELSRAMQNLQLMFQLWRTKAKGAFLWTENLVSPGDEIPLGQGMNRVVFPADCVDVLETYLYYPLPQDIAIPLTRVGRTEHFDTPMLSSQGTPFRIYCHREYNFTSQVWEYAGYLFLSPAITGQNTLRYNYIRAMKDVVNYTDNLDVPTPYLEAVVAGLAFFIARSRAFIKDAQGNRIITTDDLNRLKADADEAFELALEFGSDRANLQIYGDNSAYTGAK